MSASNVRLKPGSASDTESATAIAELIERVELSEEGICVSIKTPISSRLIADVSSLNALCIARVFPMTIKRRGVELRIILDGKNDMPEKVDPALLKAMARAGRWSEELASGRVRSLVEIAKRENLQQRYRKCRNGFYPCVSFKT